MQRAGFDGRDRIIMTGIHRQSFALLLQLQTEANQFSVQRLPGGFPAVQYLPDGVAGLTHGVAVQTLLIRMVFHLTGLTGDGFKLFLFSDPVPVLVFLTATVIRCESVFLLQFTTGFMQSEVIIIKACRTVCFRVNTVHGDVTVHMFRISVNGKNILVIAHVQRLQCISGALKNLLICRIIFFTPRQDRMIHRVLTAPVLRRNRIHFSSCRFNTEAVCFTQNLTTEHLLTPVVTPGQHMIPV